MQFTILSVALLAALASSASIPESSDTAPAAKQKRGLFGSYYAPSAAVVAHAPVYHAPLVAPAPVYHAPVAAATSYSTSSVSITHAVPKVAIAHAPLAVAPAPVYAAHAPIYAAHAPVYAAHAPAYYHAPAFYH
ncbi:cuticle protein 70, isoforms A and B-like [Macrosteles quadrilineatus]|uniref:cuticle protein 70, isoforms A and B-like n=1 Tax=Macrosteles quadrilineatus TaxID=74068 RepID=UPI0023E17706|nr:cuticle protein 70, isoforms A and B-like [Macrosteles quadrilineatus]